MIYVYENSKALKFCMFYFVSAYNISRGARNFSKKECLPVQPKDSTPLKRHCVDGKIVISSNLILNKLFTVLNFFYT